MSGFLEGAREAGRAAARAIMADLQRQWQVAVARLDTLVASRADFRELPARTAAQAQDEALNALTDEFDKLYAGWAEHGDDVASAPEGENGPSNV